LENFMQLQRNFLLALAIASGVFASAGTQAAAPMAKGQAPGFYQMMLGDFQVTALSDGTVDAPVGKLLTNVKAARVTAGLRRAYLKDPVETSVNGFLINTGTKLVLVDTGAAGLFGPTLGNLAANLKAAGYQPEQIDEIYITHMHFDHVGGLMAGGKRAFPNAVVRADKHDADYWLSQANMDKAPKEAKAFFEGAMKSLNPYVAARKFKPFDGSTELVPGVRALASRGHTPGHTTYVVESKGEKLVLIGDLVHVVAVEFPDPSVTFALETDSKAAVAQRRKAFADAAANGYWVAAAHIAFPGIGHIRAAGKKGYDWVPANYSVVR
jgi:glyoxylase-like metal-dependent hydrolase (beta-lactamase superfamily II)